MAFNLEEVDVDGAVREGAEEAFGDTRLSFLKKGALAGGAALSGGAILSALVPGAASAATFGRPPSSFGSGDVGILNYALTLEYLERDYYEAVQKKGIAKSAGAKKFLATVVRDEKSHVAFLTAGLKSAAVKQPSFDFSKYLTDEKTFLATAYALENTGVGAYLGQAGNIKSPTYLYDAATILTIEARHSGAAAMLTGKAIDITPDFDKGTSASHVLAVVKSLGVIKS